MGTSDLPRESDDSIAGLSIMDWSRNQMVNLRGSKDLHPISCDTGCFMAILVQRYSLSDSEKINDVLKGFRRCVAGIEDRPNKPGIPAKVIVHFVKITV